MGLDLEVDFHCRHLLTSRYVPGTALRILHVLTHSIRRDYYYSHFTDEEKHKHNNPSSSNWSQIMQ